MTGRVADKVAFVTGAARRLGPQNIRVNSVHPTHVNTPLLINDETFRLFRPDLANPGPDDLVLFRPSDESRDITGVVLPVDAVSCLK